MSEWLWAGLSMFVVCWKDNVVVVVVKLLVVAVSRVVSKSV